MKYFLIIFCLFSFFAGYSQGVKISDLPSATSLSGTEIVPIVQTTNKKATIGLMRGWTSIGTANQLLRVNSGATALEFFTPSYLSGVVSIANGGTGLSSLGTANQQLRVNAGGTALEYFTPSGGGSFTLTDGSGTTANSTAVDLGGQLTGNADIEVASGFQFNVSTPASSGSSGSFNVYNSGSDNNKSSTINGQIVSGQPFVLSFGRSTTYGDGAKFYDSRSTTTGIEYSADYSAGYTSRSLVDKAYVQSLIPTSSWSLGANGTFTAPLTFTGSTTNTLRFDINAIGTSQTNQSFVLGNTTAASSGNQQYSPILWQIGNGWKTTATAASQTVAFGEQVVPIQGTSAPTGYKTFFSSINGGSNSEILRLRNDGALFLPGGSGFTASLYFGTGTDGFIARGTSGTQGITIYGPNSTANLYTYSISSFNSNNYAPTSGTGGSLGLIGNFNPSSGSANMYFANTTGTINMTSTSSGNVFNYGVNQTVTAAKGNYTGFYYNPSVTSVTGSEYAFWSTRGGIRLQGQSTSSSSSPLIIDTNGNVSNSASSASTSLINSNNVQHRLVRLAHVTGATSANLGDVVSSSEISNGESVTIVVTWAAKDDSANTGAGGIFTTVWTKASGTLAKVYDSNTPASTSNTGDNLQLASSDVSGAINITIGTGTIGGNFTVSAVATVTQIKL